MNVCIATRLAGGVGVYTKALVAALVTADPDLRLLLMSPDPFDSFSSDSHNVTLQPVRRTPALPTHPGWFAEAVAFRRAITRLAEDIDVIHFPSDARHAIFCTNLHKPIVVTMNDYFNAIVTWNPGSVRRFYEDWIPRYFAYHLARLAERKALRGATRIIGISDAVGQIVGPAYGVPTEKFATVRYGLDFSPIPPNDGCMGERKQVLFVGGNFQRKGLMVLLRAVPMVLARVPDVRFTVIGKSYFERGAKRLAQSLGIANRCEFVGRVSYESLVRYYASATVLTMPSLMEAFGIPYLEGMSCGLPVVATDCRGPDEYLVDGENALVVPPADSPALGAALIRALTDSALRNRLRQGGFETASRFTPDKMATETLDVYEDAMRAGTAAGDA